MLSPKAQQLVYDYLNLPFPDIPGVRCPYFNNWKLRQRGQLRVLIGKGTPKEIVEEAKIISIQYHAGLFYKNGRCLIHDTNGTSPLPRVLGADPILCEGERMNKAATFIRKFLIDNSLGVDCSGFATHVLRAHYWETKKIDILKKLFVAPPKHFLRWAISKLRPIENIGVSILGHDNNSEFRGDGMSKIDWDNIQPADIIAIYGTGPQHNRNHIILITENNGQMLKYAHARAWPSEGKYGHGAAEGEIKIVKPNESFLRQEWIEMGKVGNENETYAIDLNMARKIEVRRLQCKN